MLLSRLPIVLSSLLAIAIGGIIYLQITEIFLPPENSTSSMKGSPATKASIAAPAPQKTFNVSSYKLFGDVSKKAPKQEVIPEKLPTTKLRLTLTGVQAGKIEEESGALIEGPDRDTAYYKVGDQLPGNATLRRVFADRIVILRSGKLENLYFPESYSANTGIQAVSDQNFDEAEVTPSPVRASNKNIIDDARKQSIKDRLSKLRQRMNPGQ